MLSEDKNYVVMVLTQFTRMLTGKNHSDRKKLAEMNILEAQNGCIRRPNQSIKLPKAAR